jgi:hypothetical protein
MICLGIIIPFLAERKGLKCVGIVGRLEKSTSSSVTHNKIHKSTPLKVLPSEKDPATYRSVCAVGNLFPNSQQPDEMAL